MPLTRPAFAAVARRDFDPRQSRRRYRCLAPRRRPFDQTMRGWQGPYVGANLGYQWGSVTGKPAEPTGVAGGVQAGYNCAIRTIRVRRRNGLSVFRRRRPFAPWKFSNPWFGTLRGARRHRDEQHAVLRHGRSRLWQPEGENTVTRVGIAHQRGLDRRRRHGGRADGQLDRAGGISLCRSQRPLHSSLTGTTWAGFELLRFGVNYRF